MISQIQNKLTAEYLGKSCSYFTVLNSTSTYIKSMWQYLPHGHTVIAAEQLSGRGRSGKSFYSPKGDGLYFSVLLKEKKYLDDPLFTVKMSYAVCRAIDKLTGTEDVKIKWVNDIYAGQKKLSGILCESLKDEASRGIIVGVGINFVLNKGEIPAELKGKIGCLRDVVKKELDKAELCALILNGIEEMYDTPESCSDFLSVYRKRSAVLGKEIGVLKDGAFVRAAALDISDDGGLLVRYENGITEKLTAGEISITMDDRNEASAAKTRRLR